MKKHQCGDWGKPYIRRANGKETSDSFRALFQISAMSVEYGPKGYYVLVQRGVPNQVMAVGSSRAEIIRSLVGCFYCRFSSWAKRMKFVSQYKSVDEKFDERFNNAIKRIEKNQLPNRYRKRSLAKRVLAPKKAT